MGTAKILLVDNDEQLRKQIYSLFSDRYLILAAENGLEALDILSSDSSFDLLLVDMVMPLMDGLEFVAELRRKPGYDSVPVVMLSKSFDLDTRRTALEAGAVGVIHKPIDPFELEFKLRNISQLSLKLKLLRERAHTDPHTGLPDAIATANNIKNEYDRCRRSSLTLALVKFRIDRFAQVDALSEKQSQTIVRLVASFLQSAFQRPNDRLGYLGGGDFILSTAEHTLNPLRIYLDSLRKSLDDLGVPHSANEPHKHVTLSIGAVLGHPHHGDMPLSLFLEEVEEALEEAAEDRNCTLCRGLH